MADVSMDYGAVENMAAGFREAAQSLQAVDGALETASALLKATAFFGMVGNLALAGYLDNIKPKVEALAATCDELNSDLLGAIASLRDGDLSGSQRFVNGGGSGGPGGGFSGNPTAPGQPGPAVGKAINYLDMYKDGVNGWRLIPMGGAFNAGELLRQIGPSCTVYSAMNLLVENGYDISQADADRLYADILSDYDPNLGNLNWDNLPLGGDLLDGSHDTEGFEQAAARRVLDRYGASYDHDDFSTWAGFGDPDRAAAEKFLIEQVNAGKPVWVSTEINESFGMGSGAHAYTVIGTQTDSSGKLTSVIVSTNWQAGGPVWEIPAQGFMDDWMEYNDGEYMVINK